MAAEEVSEPATEDPEAIVAREDRDRPRAVAAAVLAAVFPLLAQIYILAFLGERSDNEREGLLFQSEHRTEFILVAVLIGLGALATGATLLFLYQATKRRRLELPNVARVCAVVGPVLILVTSIAAQVVLGSEARDFAMSGSQTVAAAEEVFRSDAVQTLLFARLAGQLAIAFAFVLICLNAMRAGLLTRFMGVLGIIVGVLLVIPLGSPLPIVQTFWFGALALLFSGRWPNGMPPAWASGEAVPWPTQQEIREQRERDRDRDTAGPAPEPESGREPDPEPAAVTTGGPAHSSSKKRKRKRRR